MSLISSGWKSVPLADLCLAVSKVDPEAFSRADFAYVDIGSIDSDTNSVKITERTLSSQAPGRARQLLQTGDTVFSTVRPYLKKIALIDESLNGEVASTGFCVLRPDQELLDPRFLFHFMTSDALLDQVLPLQRGVSYPAVRDRDVLSARIPLPPLDEQQRIVAVLEEHLNRLDVATSSITHAHTLSTIFRRSMANDVSAGWAVAPELRGQLDAEGRPRLGPGWSWKSVEEITGGVKTNVTIGPFGSNLKVADYCESGTPLVFVRNIRSKEFLPLGQPHISAEKAATLTAHQAVKGDVLVTKMGDPPGDCAVYPLNEPAVITSDCLRLRPTGDFLPDFLAIAIESGLVRSQILAITSGVAQKKVSLARFRRGVLIPCPAFSMQVEMADRFNSAIEATQRSINGARHLDWVDALRRGLLDAAFSGELVVREVGSADV